MKKAISVDRKRGRPATGERPAISARVSKDVFANIESWAGQHKISHSEAIRQLVELGLVASVPASKQASKLAWRKKSIERWAERLADLGWRQRLDGLLRAAVHGSMQPQMWEGLPIQGGLRGEDYVKQEAWELFGIRWPPTPRKPKASK